MSPVPATALPVTPATTLATPLESGQVWRGAGRAVHPRAPVPTGFPVLDEVLGGGWPSGHLLEILVGRGSQGELGLLLPALAAVSRGSGRVPGQEAEGSPVLLLSPPHIPYAPALVQGGVNLSRWLVVPGSTGDDSRGPKGGASSGFSSRHLSSQDLYWALEESLASGACGAVVAWGGRAGRSVLQRLQGAVDRGGGLAFLIRPVQCQAERSPAALRLRLDARSFPALRLEFLRNRFGRQGVLPVVLPAVLSDSLPDNAAGVPAFPERAA